MWSVIYLAILLASIDSLDCFRPRVLSERLNFFDIDLLKYTGEGQIGNVMVSPASIKSTLAMILEGANGVTAAEIRSALRLSPVKEELREQLNLYLKALQSNTTGVSIQNSNTVFVSKNLQLQKEYETMLKHIYYSDVARLNFSEPMKAADVINGWIKNNTKGLIPSIIDPVDISPFTEIILTNALYFKGKWLYSFDPLYTRSECFYLNGVCRKVALMDLDTQLNYAYVDELRAHAVELPYEGNKYSMLLLVPHDRDGWSALIRDLPYVSLPRILSQMYPVEVQLSMPKFTVDHSEDMVRALQNMRISSLFTPTANLSGIFEKSTPHVDNIFHKVYVSVDEAGTVAAAASAAMVVPLINDRVELRVDRPFVFFIKDNSLGLVLFEGIIQEPTEYVEKIQNGTRFFNPETIKSLLG